MKTLRRGQSDHLPAVRVDGLVFGRVHVGHVHVNGFVFHAQLLQDDDHFPRVGARGVGVELDGLRHDGGGSITGGYENKCKVFYVLLWMNVAGKILQSEEIARTSNLLCMS